MNFLNLKIIPKSSNNIDKQTIINLGKRIKYLRNEKNMTQMDLAAILNIDASAVRRYESGKVEMGFTTLIKFSEALGVGVEDLV